MAADATGSPQPSSPPAHFMPPGAVHPLQKLFDKVDRHERILDGVPDEDLPGLRQRMSEAEKVIAEWKKLKTMFQGALVFMGLSTATNAGLFVALAKSLGWLP